MTVATRYPAAAIAANRQRQAEQLLPSRCEPTECAQQCTCKRPTLAGPVIDASVIRVGRWCPLFVDRRWQ